MGCSSSLMALSFIAGDRCMYRCVVYLERDER